MSDNRLNVIIVDDEKSVGLISELNFRKAIQNGSVNFKFFEDATSCINYLEQLTGSNSPCAVLTDINMPNISGFDLLGKISAQFPQVEVFMMSAYDDSACIDKSLKMGAKGYFTKPVDYKSIKIRLEADFGVAL